VAVVEDDAHGVAPDRLGADDADIGFACHRRRRIAAMAFVLRGGAFDAQEFERNVERGAVVEADMQGFGRAVERKIGRPGAGLRCCLHLHTHPRIARSASPGPINLIVESAAPQRRKAEVMGPGLDASHRPGDG
jgi:hypothetical protein